MGNGVFSNLIRTLDLTSIIVLPNDRVIRNDGKLDLNNAFIREEYADRAKVYGETEYSRTLNTKKYIALFREFAK